MAKVSLLTTKSETFSKFHSRDTSLRDEPRPESSLVLCEDSLRELVECNLCKST